MGAIIPSHAPVDARGHIVPGYVYIDADETIPFWRELGKRVPEHECKIVQLVFAGRERMIREAGVDMIHVSTGAGFPHPRHPAGRFPARDPGISIADGSVMPGPVAPNSSLTIAALADRVADRILEQHGRSAR